MARIRTIKPEFPHSESMGRVSRDARLCFVLLWTLADDYGRLRASSRVLASLLYPFDDDAKDLIENWLTELESVNCILRYQHDSNTYLEIINWSAHQKVDKPSQPKIISFAEASRDPREGSRDPRRGSGSGSGPLPVKDPKSDEPEKTANRPASENQNEAAREGIAKLRAIVGTTSKALQV